MKIAIIGAGIFGTTAALKLKDAGHDVHLFEQYGDILQGASGINQYRLHKGFHYPRSDSTAISSRLAEPLFLDEYPEAIVRDSKHYYAIAKEGSKVSAEEFKDFCRRCDLQFNEADLSCIDEKMVDLIVEVEEKLMDPIKLREIVSSRLEERGVNLHLNNRATSDLLSEFDLVINAAYAHLNTALNDVESDKKFNYQFEVCEKPVIKLPEEFQKKSIVILDGPFMCIDPYSDTDFHVMGHVVHAIHATNTGLLPEIPEELKSLLHKGVIQNPSITNFKKFIEAGAAFMPLLSKAEHVGSMYTIRTVLPNVDKTDERPTLVYRATDRIINIFSGKIGNSVQAALDVVKMVEEIISSNKESTR